MASSKKLSTRLLALRKKFPGVSQREMAAHFNIKLRMYQRYETGEKEPEEYKLRKIEQRIDFLDRLQTLPPLQTEQSPKNIKVVTSNYVPSNIDDLKAELLKKEMKIESLEDVVASLNLLVKLLSEKAGVPVEKFRNQPTT